nr:dicarboxylate/amino acid:cation symporter [Saccharofermentans sp.]
YSLADNMDLAKIDLDEASGDEIQESIRKIILDSMTNHIKYSHSNGTNYIRMTVIRSKRTFLYATIGSMVLAVLLGLLFSAVLPEGANNFLNDNFLDPVSTMFMNALKMIVGPVVFFSIVSCIVQFSDISSLGRIGGKIIGTYMITTAIAIAVGIGVFTLLRPGDASMAQTLADDASAISSQTVEVSIKDTIVGIIPSDIITPFLESNMLQLIFLAVICGIAASMLGKYSKLLTDLFTAFNDLFLKITAIIVKAMPIAIFCSILSMMLRLGIKTMFSVLGMFGTFLLGLAVMMCIYCLILILFGRLNPLPFIKKYAPSMLQVFSLSSSSASVPLNLEACEKKLGINKRISSLSIPLGATLNMHGTCIYLAIFALALAKIYGVEVTGSMMMSMVVSIFILSVGAPGIPGSGLICLSVLITQMHVPVEAIGLIMGIDALCGMFRTMSNCLGDVAVSLIVARSEKAIDLKTYKDLK